MKELEIPNGGMPFQGGDLMYLQTALREAILGVAKGLSSKDRFILSNKSIYASNAANHIISGSWIYMNLELLYFPTKELPLSADLNAYGIFKKVSYDPAGADIFNDGLTKDTYKVSEGEIKLIAGNSGSNINLGQLDSFLLTATQSRHTVFSNAGNKLEVVRDGNVVCLQGTVLENIQYEAIPQLYRPSYMIAGFSVGIGTAKVYVQPTGEVIVQEFNNPGTISLTWIV